MKGHTAFPAGKTQNGEAKLESESFVGCSKRMTMNGNCKFMKKITELKRNWGDT
jgi:hypothetical protein